MYDGRSDLPLMAYWGYEGWQIWIRGQVTHCLHLGLSGVAEMWERKGRSGCRELSRRSVHDIREGLGVRQGLAPSTILALAVTSRVWQCRLEKPRRRN